MTDNTTLPIPTTSGDVIATDDIGGVKFQRIKIITGADGVNDGDVSSANPLPVEITGQVEVSGSITDGTATTGQMLLVGGQTAGGVAQVFETNASGHLHIADGGGSITVDATSLPLPTGAATDETLQAVLSLQSEIRDLNDTLITLLSSIFEKMPRVTATDQAAVSIETGTVAVSSLPTLGTVTTVATVSTVTNQAQIGGQEALTLARAQIMQGTSHIYNNIEVS